MPEENKPEEFDLSDSKGVTKLREAYERQQAARDKAEHELAQMRAENRSMNVRSILEKMHAPAQIADLYPADAEINEDSLRTFLKDKVGIEPEQMEAWKRYENVTNHTSPPPPAKDEMEEWAEKELAKTEAFYRRTNHPTEEETKDLQEFKSKVFKKLVQWDNEVATGQRDPLVNPQGFGGFLDPPKYARRARHYVSSVN